MDVGLANGELMGGKNRWDGSFKGGKGGEVESYVGRCR